MQFSERSTILNFFNFLRGARFSILFLARLRTMRLGHSASGSMFESACAGSVSANMTSVENLLVSVLRIGAEICVARSYFSLRYCVRSLNFSMLMSLRLAPSNFELMLLSLRSPVLRCFDIVINYQNCLTDGAHKCNCFLACFCFSWIFLQFFRLIAVFFKFIQNCHPHFLFYSSNCVLTLNCNVSGINKFNHFAIIFMKNGLGTTVVKGKKGARPFSLSTAIYKKEAAKTIQIGSLAENAFMRIGSYTANRSDLLGKGFCSKVYKAVHQSTGEQVALKLIDLQKIKSVVHRRFLKNEIDCLKNMKNTRHVIHLREIIQTKTHLAIVTELCVQSLSQLMKKGRGVKEALGKEKAFKVFGELVLGYMALRRAGFIHRDIKPANILIGQDGEIRLCDLGFATRQSRINEDRFVNVGSPLYMAPQIMRDNSYSNKGDIWALGLVLFQMLTGHLPWEFAKQSQLKGIVAATNFQQLLPRDLNVNEKLLILGCLDKNPRNRCTVLDLMRFFKPDFEESKFISNQPQKQSMIIQFTQLAEQGITKMQTVHTEELEEVKYCRQQHCSNQNSRYRLKSVSRGQTTAPTALQLSEAMKKSMKTSVKIRSSKRLRQTKAEGEQQLMFLKLNGESEDGLCWIKRQQMSNLHLGRLLFKIIEMIDKAKDNIHCFYFGFEDELATAMAGSVMELFKDIRQLNSSFDEKEVQQFKKSSEYRSLLSIVQQYQNNYRQYFELKLGLKQDQSHSVSVLPQMLEHYLKKANAHAMLIFEQVMSSGLQEVTDPQICEFMALIDCFSSLAQLLKLKGRNTAIFVRTNGIEGLLKQEKKIFGIADIKKLSKFLLN